MDEPKRIELTPDELAKLLSRLDAGELSDEDLKKLKDVLLAMVWMSQKLEDRELSIRRLQRLFGIKTETAEKLFGKKPNGDGSDSASEPAVPAGHNGAGGGSPPPNGGSGRHGAADYPDAEKIVHRHKTLKIGDVCPECDRGKLYFFGYGSVVKLIGQPAIKAVIHMPEQLRCSACMTVFTASLPEEVGRGRADPTAKSMVALFRYGSGIPFYRNEGLQNFLRTPLPDSTQWDMSEDVANCALPIYKALLEEAAQMDLMHSDDTGGRILSLMKENKETNPERKGIFTTGILAKSGERQICLMFTGGRRGFERARF